MSTYDQFVQFGVDSFGLERTLRLFQSLAHIALSTPLLALPIPPTDLLTLRSTLNLTRRVIRTFRFLSCFSAVQVLYASASPLSLEAWLEVTKLGLLGIYGLLETATLPDMAGMEVFGAEGDLRINLEAQRFWFLALVCGVVGGVLRFFALGAVPATGADDEDAKGEKEGEKERARKAAAAEEERRKAGEMKRALVRKVAADAVDMVLPVAVLGWADVDPAIAGAAMFVSTIVSGYDVWKGVGVQMRASASKA